MDFYRVELTSEARKELRHAPGHLRARILQLLHTLERSFSPPGSRQLDLAQIEDSLTSGMELWRVRLDAWRVIYVVDSEERIISVLAIRQRPPYQYEDLNALIRRQRR